MSDQFSLKVDGVPMPGALFGDIMEVTVDTDVFMPAMFTILLNDTPMVTGQPLLKYSDNALLFRLGSKVEIAAKVSLPGSPISTSNTLLNGEVTSIEPQFRDDGNVQLLIRGYDAAHRLTLGKKTRAWGTGLAPTVTEAEIVSKIAQENGLSPLVNLMGLAGVMYDYVMQYNQSDWDFLWSRAQLLGYQVYVDGSKLNFSPAAVPRQPVPVNLIWGTNLKSFRPRFATAGAVTAVQARGWNSDLKNSASGNNIPMSSKLDMPSSPLVAKLLSGSLSIQAGFKSKAKDYLLEPVIKNPAIGTIVANARFLQHESHFVAASGECDGDPNLVAGSNAVVLNVGVRFAGTYFVTQARHIFRSGDYKVTFEVSGRNPYTFRHMLGRDPEINKIYGAVIGLVTDLNDPLMQGRLKIKFPWMPADPTELSSEWVRMATLGGGKGGGLYFAPEVDDEVLVVFEQGDVNYPYIVGVLWNGRDKSPAAPSGKAVLGGQVNQRIIRSPSGHVVVLDDTPGKEMILIQDKGGNKIQIDSVKNELTIKTTGNMTLDIGGKFALDAKAGFEIKSAATGKIEGTGGVDIKAGASELNLQAAQADLKAPTVNVEGQAQTSIKGNAMVQIQGGIVKIN